MLAAVNKHNLVFSYFIRFALKIQDALAGYGVQYNVSVKFVALGAVVFVGVKVGQALYSERQSLIFCVVCVQIGKNNINIKVKFSHCLYLALYIIRIFYHGVLTSCNGYVYSFGAAITDIDEPWKVKYRTSPYLLSPQEIYECVGDVPNVTFPCAALADADTGRIAIYYGCADTVTGLAFCRLDELIAYIKENTL